MRHFERTVVYAVQIGKTGPVKIGWCCRMSSRLAELQRANPKPLRVIMEQGAPTIYEKYLQGFLRADHIRGEWFRPTPAVLDALARFEAGWRPPVATFVPDKNPDWGRQSGNCGSSPGQRYFKPLEQSK